MTPEAIAAYMAISTEEARRLLALAPTDVYADPVYQDAVKHLDADMLQQTLAHVRTAYDDRLDVIKARYGLSDTIMSGFTLGNWVLGYLSSPDYLSELLGQHANLSQDVIKAALPELVDLLDDLPEGRAEWQRALVTLSLPLIAAG